MAPPPGYHTGEGSRLVSGSTSLPPPQCSCLGVYGGPFRQRGAPGDPIQGRRRASYSQCSFWHENLPPSAGSLSSSCCRWVWSAPVAWWDLISCLLRLCQPGCCSELHAAEPRLGHAGLASVSRTLHLCPRSFEAPALPSSPP